MNVLMTSIIKETQRLAEWQALRGQLHVEFMSRNLQNRFAINGTTFQVPAEDLVYENDDDVCYASFGKGGLRFAILGDTFLKNNYVVFIQEVPKTQTAPTRY
ncbi:hypothetical protein EDC96DRAFT_540858 [Choanephora cucurbitarum]|nr:hypothetical protein EDC96DRAFT_540858 [Choanephora cucurbitarum]